MKTLLIDELRSLLIYLKRNWSKIFLSFALGLLLFWLLDFNQSVVDVWIQKVAKVKPHIALVLVFEWLILLSLHTKIVSFWSCYRKSYFIENTSLSWVDSFIIVLSPLLYWLRFQYFINSEYFFYVFLSLVLFILGTYIIALIPLIKDYLERKRFENDKFVGKTVLFSDEPIDNNEDDLIGRANFAQALKENIYNLSFKQSFVMALYGRWGEGKTSILNLLKKEVQKERHLLIYEFDPWFYGDENALTVNFYRGLEDLLQESYFVPRKIKRILRLYPEILIKGFTSIGFDFRNKNEEDRPAELKNEIEDFVAGLDKKVLVIIDDVDRLQKDEVLALFRLIKLTSHIKNLVFLISFDVERVVKILEAADFKDPQGYIEKIIQLPINIPMTDQSKIDKFLLYSYPAIQYKSEIDKLLDRLGLDSEDPKRKEFDKELVHIYQSDLRQIFSTYRSAKRYMNSILFRLPFIQREVFLYDFFIVEVIQTFYPEVYADMKSSPWYYLSSGWSFDAIAISRLPHDHAERNKLIRTHIEKLIDGMTNKDTVLSLLQSIFPQVKNAFSRNGSYHVDAGSARIDKRIAHPECYAKYFMLGTREGLIPDEEFEDMLKHWQQSSTPEADIEKSLFDKYQKEFKLIQLFERLKLHSKLIEKPLVMPVINVIYKNSDKLQHDGDLWMTEFDQADGVIFRLIEDRKDSIKDEGIQPLIEKIVEEAPAFDFSTLIVLTCNEKEGSSLKRLHANVNTNELRSIFDKRLSEYFIKGGKNIFEEYSKEREFAFILYNWATNWGAPSSPIKEKVTKYLINIFKDKPTTIALFLKHNIKEDKFFDEKKHFDYAGFIVAYDAKQFAECLAELGERAVSTESEKEIIELFLEKYKEANPINT